MPAADTAKLIAALTLKDGFTGPLTKANGALSKFDANLDKTQNRANIAGQQIGTGIKNGVKLAAVGVGLLATQVVAGVNSLINLEKITTQTDAALASTKDVSGQTAAGIRTMSNAFEDLNAQMDDAAIQGGANILLTFTNIRDNAFKPALAATLDLSQALGKDLESSAILVGKALNDPVKGLTALTKAGVLFTPQQKAQIAALVGTGDVLKDLGLAHVELDKGQKATIKSLGGTVSALDAAQKAGVKLTDRQKTLLSTFKNGSGIIAAQGIILKELGTEFGGSFEKAGGTIAGQFASVGDAVEDLQRSLAGALLPSLSKVAHAVRTALTDPAVIAGVTDLGNKVASLFSDANLKSGADALKSVFQIAKDVAPAIESAAKVTGQVVKTAVDLFRSLPPELQSLAIAGLAVNKLTGGLVTNIAGGLISAVISSFKGLMNVNAAVVNVNGPAGGLPGGGAATLGGGLLSTASGLAVPVTIAAIAAEAATALANADIANKGLTGKFETPGSGVLPFGIDSSIQNLITATNLLNQNNTRNNGPDASTLTADRHFGEAVANAIKTSSTENQPGKSQDDRTFAAALKENTAATKAQTAAAKVLSSAEINSTISADRVARGLTGPFKRSTSLDPRINFLNQNRAGSKDIAVSHAIALGFERGATPLFRKTDQIPRAIKALQRDQHQLLAHGDPKSAAAIGADITRLKAELSRRLTSVRNAVKQIPPPKVTVNIKSPTSLFLNGRLFDSANGRFKSTIVGSRGSTAEFG